MMEQPLEDEKELLNGAEVVHCELECPGGIRLHYVEAGPQEGPLVSSPSTEF